jgi:hypothetical protein
MGPQFCSRNRRINRIGAVLDEWRERAAFGRIEADHEIDAAIGVERQVMPDTSVPCSGVFARRAVWPIDTKADQDALGIEQKLEHAFVVAVVRQERVLEIGERTPAPLVEREQSTETGECARDDLVQFV